VASVLVKLLGGFEARLSSGPQLDIAAKKTRALMAYLALPTGRAHSREKLIGLLWSERSDEQARNSLRQALTELGRALGAVEPSPLIKARDTLALDPLIVEVDATQFEQLATGDKAGDLRHAAALYAGDLLEGFSVPDPAFEEWLVIERQRLRGLATSVLRKLLIRETGPSAIAAAQRLLTLDPLQEESHRALMRLHADTGEVGLALRQYEICRETLMRELGAAPSPDTEALHREIKRQSGEPASRRGNSTGAPAEMIQLQSSVDASKPSIAVLPFENLSGDPEQEYFADGMVEDIITALAHFRHLFVIARNSSFTYKGRAVDVKQVGRELGVRYVLEGSVRKAGNRARVTGQLIDASTGATLWADRFDGTLAEIFDLQDQVAANVVGAIAPRVEEAEIERAKRKPTESLDAYDHYLRALAILSRITSETTSEALRLFNKAIERDPEFALAYARAAQCYVFRKVNGWMVDRAQETSEAARLARHAVDLGRNDAIALAYGGLALGYVAGELDDGAAFVDAALALNPNLAAAWGFSSWMKSCLGDVDTAINHAERAMRLSPLDPGLFLWRSFTALAHFCALRYDDASVWAERALRDQPDYGFPMRVAAASYALAGRLAEARKVMARLRQVDPQLRLSNLGDVISPLRPAFLAKYVEGLRIAGLPD